MTKVLLLALVCFATNISAQTTNKTGQSTNSKKSGIIAEDKKAFANDTTLKVVYVDSTQSYKPVAYYLNGKFVNQTFIRTLNPEQIESLTVIKDNIQIGDVYYNGGMEIKTKSAYNPKIISLSQLKEKYTNLKNKPTIIMIDGDIIGDDYDNYFVDEKNLLTITIDKVKNSPEKIDVGLIKLLTKSEDNIKKSKEIWIRGAKQLSVN